MRQYFVDMQLIYANMQNNFVHMQLHHKTCRVKLHRVSKTFDCIQISDCKQNNVALEKHTIALFILKVSTGRLFAYLLIIFKVLFWF